MLSPRSKAFLDSVAKAERATGARKRKAAMAELKAGVQGISEQLDRARVPKKMVSIGTQTSPQKIKARVKPGYEMPRPIPKLNIVPAPKASESERCSAILVSGARKGKECGRPAKPGTLFCGLHRDIAKSVG